MLVILNSWDASIKRCYFSILLVLLLLFLILLVLLHTAVAFLTCQHSQENCQTSDAEDPGLGPTKTTTGAFFGIFHNNAASQKCHLGE